MIKIKTQTPFPKQVVIMTEWQVETIYFYKSIINTTTSCTRLHKTLERWFYFRKTRLFTIWDLAIKCPSTASSPLKTCKKMGDFVSSNQVSICIGFTCLGSFENIFVPVQSIIHKVYFYKVCQLSNYEKATPCVKLFFFCSLLHQSVVSLFFNAGQCCIAGSRTFVH